MVHMEVKVLELKPDKVRMAFVGEGHTFMNVLTDELLKDPGVDVARYIREFQFSDPELLVTTTGDRNAIDAVRDACVRISGHCDELLTQISS
jgi:DNA-directed RNA polymerase subunit L